MGLRVELDWFDKETEYGVGQEYSMEFGEDGAIMGKLKLPVAHNVNNGGFDVEREWLVVLQPLFKHSIDMDIYDYRVSFVYRD